MPEDCKLVTCCDPDDFDQESSGEDNCPVGTYWNGSECVQCAIPAAPSLVLAANQITNNFDVGAGLLYKIERSTDQLMWVQVTSGTGGGGTETYADAVTAGTKYYYRIVVAVSALCGYINGEIASAKAI